MSTDFEPLGRFEQRFETARRRLGPVLAAAAFALVWLGRFPSLRPEAHRLAAVMAAVVVLWLTEAIPLPVTAMLGAALCVVLQVADAQTVFSPFADPIMFLFIGSFILARAIFVHHLDRRLAFGVLSLRVVGGSPSRILFAFGAVTALISGWISNTATTAMMFAIGMSILGFLFEPGGEASAPIDRRYATGLMLMTSFAASIGGLATPIGTPPNLIGLGAIRRELNVDVPFLNWTVLGVPIVACLFLFLYLYLNRLCAAGAVEVGGSREMLRREGERLGPWTSGQISTLVAFGVTVVLWVVPGIVALTAGNRSEIYRIVSGRMPEAVAAVFGAGLLFVLPGDRDEKAITWHDAVQIDWGVVLLYGGGFALGILSDARHTGLADALGRGIGDWIAGNSDLGLLAATTLAATLVSELTSNTASATIVVPMAISIARSTGVDPFEPALGATFGASLGFMLPVSTPCNAIVYGSGYIPLVRMVRYGLLLDIAGTVAIVVFVRLLSPLVRP